METAIAVPEVDAAPAKTHETARVESAPATKQAEQEAGEPIKGKEAQKRIRQLLAENKELRKELLFSPEQQKAFDRAFGKREAKIRQQCEERLHSVIQDLLELAALTEQILSRCQDLDPQDAEDIRHGLQEIRSEYEKTNST